MPGRTIRTALLLGSEPRIVIPVARALARHGVTVDVAQIARGDPLVRSRAIRQVTRLPGNGPQDPETAAALLTLLQDGTSMILPCSDSALVLLSRRYDEFARHARIRSPRPEVVARVLDKGETLRLAASAGIEAPPTIELPDAPSAADLEWLRYPLVVKSADKRGPRGRKVDYVATPEDLHRRLAQDPSLGRDNLIQEFCLGYGVGVELLIHQGEPVLSFQHRRLKELPATGGVSVVARGEPVDSDLLERSVALLRTLEWEGVAMVEFRRDPESGRTVLMEVNGRYWGTISLPIMAGVDFPGYDWKIGLGETVAPRPSPRARIRWRWSAGCLKRFHSVLTDPPTPLPNERPSSVSDELLGLAGDLLPGTRSAMFSASDPLPAITEFTGVLQTFAGQVTRWLARRLMRPQSPPLVRDLLRLRGRARGTYLMLAARRWAGVRPTDPPKPIGRGPILFVCYGNIMRSAMAEALLRQCLASRCEAPIGVTSAGLHSVPGKPADPRARAMARAFGISLDQHEARRLTRELVVRASLILVMDRLNEAELIARFGAAGKTRLLGAFLPGEPEIADPYLGGEAQVEESFLLLDRAVRALADRLLEGTRGYDR